MSYRTGKPAAGDCRHSTVASSWFSKHSFKKLCELLELVLSESDEDDDELEDEDTELVEIELDELVMLDELDELVRLEDELELND